MINKDLLHYYHTPGYLYHLLKFAENNEINLNDLGLKELILKLINESYYKKDPQNKYILYDLIEIFLLKKVSTIYSEISFYFLKKINNYKKFNLDDESFFLEINSKLLNE